MAPSWRPSCWWRKDSSVAADSIRIRATASVANVSCGFDCLGYAIPVPGDTITIRRRLRPGLTISVSGTNAARIPLQPEKNTAGKAILSLLEELGSAAGFQVDIAKGIPAGSGLGSSAASAAAAVTGVNLLLGSPLSANSLIVHGMAGEAVASQALHADNVAPALLGGIILIRSYDPLDILQLPVPEWLYSTVVLPELTINTGSARSILPDRVPLRQAVTQAGNLAGFTLGLVNGDFDLLGRSMVDLLAEPYRQALIPGFAAVRRAALDNGAIGCGISGSGPALFALSGSATVAEIVGRKMRAEFRNAGLASICYSSPISSRPPAILD
ncbi:MAG: homoserine kinase [Candidatus Neomarinimicrobiota bacterium]